VQPTQLYKSHAMRTLMVFSPHYHITHHTQPTTHNTKPYQPTNPPNHHHQHVSMVCIHPIPRSLAMPFGPSASTVMESVHSLDMDGLTNEQQQLRLLLVRW